MACTASAADVDPGRDAPLILDSCAGRDDDGRLFLLRKIRLMCFKQQLRVFRMMKCCGSHYIYGYLEMFGI